MLQANGRGQILYCYCILDMLYIFVNNEKNIRAIENTGKTTNKLRLGKLTKY